MNSISNTVTTLFHGVKSKPPGGGVSVFRGVPSLSGPLAFLCRVGWWVVLSTWFSVYIYYLMQNEMFIPAERMLLWCLFTKLGPRG